MAPEGPRIGAAGPSPLAIVTIGRHARDFVQRHTSAIVAARFGRSLHLEAPDGSGGMVCLGDLSIGNGPLNAVLDETGWRALAGRLSAAPAARGGRHGRDGQHGPCVDPGGTSAPSILSMLSIASARLWSPPPWPERCEQGALVSSLDTLGRIAHQDAPAEGLARLVLSPGAVPRTAVERVAAPRIAELQHWLRSGAGSPPVDLLGLGPGLTPSGDDVLCGVLVGLDATGRHAMRDRLSHAVSAAAPGLTTPLSGAFLAAAAHGHGHEALHAVIISMLDGRTGEISTRAADCGRIGHTSGWDALAGAALGLASPCEGV